MYDIDKFAQIITMVLSYDYFSGKKWPWTVLIKQSEIQMCKLRVEFVGCTLMCN